MRADSRSSSNSWDVDGVAVCGVVRRATCKLPRAVRRAHLALLLVPARDSPSQDGAEEDCEIRLDGRGIILQMLDVFWGMMLSPIDVFQVVNWGAEIYTFMNIMQESGMMLSPKS